MVVITILIIRLSPVQKREIPYLKHRDFLGPGYFVVYDQLLTFTLDTLAPSLTLLVLNILIYRHLRAFR